MLTAELEGVLVEACATFAVPGAQIGIMRGDDRFVLCAGTLAATGSAAVDPSTPFHAGSLAKSLTSLLVVDAANRGLIEMDTPCSEQAAGVWDDTPRALMSHTSGRPNGMPLVDEDIESFVARIGAEPRVHEPGRFSYCNAGWSVLDLLLRQCCGGTFEELATDRILGPGATFGIPQGAAVGHGVGVDAPLHEVRPDDAAAASAAGARWWATADQLLDHAALNLGDSGSREFDQADLEELRRPHVTVPGSTVADSWGLGWAVWDRGPHRAFGWAGYTAGHRAYLRCFPDHHAAIVLLANSAGPLLTAPGGSALFDALLPHLLNAADLPPLPPPLRPVDPRPTAELAGGYGPVHVTTAGADAVDLHARALGAEQPVAYQRCGGNTFDPPGLPPGSLTIAFDDELLYVGPFALPRNRP